MPGGPINPKGGGSAASQSAREVASLTARLEVVKRELEEIRVRLLDDPSGLIPGLDVGANTHSEASDAAIPMMEGTQVLVDSSLTQDANGSIDFHQEQALQLRIENRTSDPSSPTTGEIWLRTDL